MSGVPRHIDSDLRSCWHCLDFLAAGSCSCVYCRKRAGCYTGYVTRTTGPSTRPSYCSHQMPDGGEESQDMGFSFYLIENMTLLSVP